MHCAAPTCMLLCPALFTGLSGEEQGISNVFHEPAAAAVVVHIMHSRSGPKPADKPAMMKWHAGCAHAESDPSDPGVQCRVHRSNGSHGGGTWHLGGLPAGVYCCHKTHLPAQMGVSECTAPSLATSGCRRML